MGHHDLQVWGEAGSFGVGASRGCMRRCFNYLNQRGAIGQTSAAGPFIRRERWRLPAAVPARGDNHE